MVKTKNKKTKKERENGLVEPPRLYGIPNKHNNLDSFGAS